MGPCLSTCLGLEDDFSSLQAKKGARTPIRMNLRARDEKENTFIDLGDGFKVRAPRATSHPPGRTGGGQLARPRPSSPPHRPHPGHHHPGCPGPAAAPGPGLTGMPRGCGGDRDA